MEEHRAYGKALRDKGFIGLGTVLVVFAVVAFATYTAEPSSHALVQYAMAWHTEIMAGLIIVAALFGFTLSQRLYAEIEREHQGSRDILETMLLFLSEEEKNIMRLLVEQGGTTNQAEVARLPGMNRVKAHRSLQKMQEKRIIELVPHGKMRRVRLREHLHTVLENSGPGRRQLTI